MATLPPLDLETAASLVPEPLCSRLQAFADREDQLILADLHRQYGRPDGSLALPPTWQAEYSSGTAAGWAMFGLARWEQVQKPEFRDLVLAVADAYVDALPDEDVDVWPMSFGHVISAEVAAYRLHGERLSRTSSPVRPNGGRPLLSGSCSAARELQDRSLRDNHGRRLVGSRLAGGRRGSQRPRDGDSCQHDRPVSARFASDPVEIPFGRWEEIHAMCGTCTGERIAASLALVLGLAWAEPGFGQPPDLRKLFQEGIPTSPFADVAYRYADAMLQKGRNVHGPRQTGLFLDLLDRQSLSPLITLPPAPAGIEPGNRWVDGANLQNHENLLRLLYFLSELSGEDRYAQAADNALKGMLLNTPSPVTGLLPWGEHMSWDVMADNAVSDSASRLHEFSRPWMLWERCFALAPDQSGQLVRGLWRFHVVDDEAVGVSPSADFDGAGRPPAAAGDRAAGFFIRPWAAAYAHTNDRAVPSRHRSSARAIRDKPRFHYGRDRIGRRSRAEPLGLVHGHRL